jgi:hypothetical protein
MVNNRLNHVAEVLEQAERRRAEKIRTLRALIEDPELSGIIDELFSKSSDPSPALRNGHKPEPELSPTLTEAIRGLGRVLPHMFTVGDVTHALTQSGFPFKRDAIASTRDAFYGMVSGGKDGFRLAEKGGPGKPNFYRYEGP